MHYYASKTPLEHIATASVDLIYLDPPFNSRRSYNFLFKEESGKESEQEYFQALESAGSFELAGSWLTVHYNHDQDVLDLVKFPDRKFDGHLQEIFAMLTGAAPHLAECALSAAL